MSYRSKSPSPRQRIFGIDPGSRNTGFAVIDSDGQHSIWIASGCIRVGEQPWPARLGTLFDRIAALIAEHQPHVLATEQLIFARDPSAALKLGQARGAVLCAGIKAGLPISEYGPKVVKRAVVGTGNAEKAQVQQMVKRLLALAQLPGEDEADALAIALCHAHSSTTITAAAGTSWRAWHP